MAQIIREITVDVAQTNNLRAITAKQNDLHSRFLKVHITNEGSALSVNADSQVIMNVQRTDNTTRMFYGSVNNDGSVTVPLTPWMLGLPGSITCDISIVSTKDLQKLTTMKFSIYVEEAVFPQEVLEDTEEYDVLIGLLAAAEDAEKCVEATEDALEAAEKAESAASGVIVVEQNQKAPLTFWVGTKEEYDAILEPDLGCFYIISDDSDLEGLQKQMADVINAVASYQVPYDISNAFVPENPDDIVTLTKCGNILTLTLGITTVNRATTPSGRYIINNDTLLGTIHGYVPTTTLYASPICDVQVDHTLLPQIELKADKSGKNTLVTWMPYINDLGTSTLYKGISEGALVAYLNISFICK